MTLKYSIATIGCKVNQIDSGAIGSLLDGAGYTAVEFGQPADLMIINTCAVTANADRDGRKQVARARKANPSATVLVTGCSPNASQEADAYPEADIICGNAEKQELLSLIQEHAATKMRLERVSPANHHRGIFANQPVPLPGRTRAFCKVQDGCDHSCSYCIVPNARGKSRSVPLNQVRDHFAGLVRYGFREIVLTGIHLGDWGLDLQPPQDIAHLIDSLTGTWTDVRLRLSSIEPMEVSERLIELLAERKNFCPHLHIPLQSGCDRVLANMGRDYDVSEFGLLMEKILAARPEATLGADVIVGFPGETDADFEQGYRMIESSPLAHLHVFPFSPRPGTAAEDLPDHVEPEVLRERAAKLRALGDRKRLDHYRKFIGSTLEVLSEGDKGDGFWGGMSANYIPVRMEQEVGEGRIVPVKIEKTGTLGARPVLLGHLDK